MGLIRVNGFQFAHLKIITFSIVIIFYFIIKYLITFSFKINI